MAMLGNTRTHIRNVVGNTLFGAVTRVKDDLSAILQKVLPESERTNSILNPLSETDSALKSAARDNADGYVWARKTAPVCGKI